MTRLSAMAAALCASLLAGAVPAAGAQAAEGATARVIVKLKADSGMLRKQALATDERHVIQAAALGQRIGIALTGGADVGERSQVVLARGLSSQALADRLAQQGDVEYAVPDGRKRIGALPNDARYSSGGAAGPAVGQWYLRAPTNAPGTAVASIDAPAAWDITAGSSSVVVAVLDTGIRYEHPDLKWYADGGNLLPGYDMIADADTANDGNGRRDADPSDPGDWIDAEDIDVGKFDGDCGYPDIAASSWHGTQTAGLIGALTNNRTGMASVGRQVRILPVRVLGKCGGFDSDILAGMRWAAGIHVDGVPDNPHPAQVINLSLGGGSTCTAAYRSAVEEIVARGVTIVASAGNSTGHAVSEPASCAGVIGVAGLRHIGTKVGFSDLGPQISISAPGGNCVNDTGACLYPILTTTNRGSKQPGGSTYTDATNASVGTSFSAPLVAGTAALMVSANAALTPATVRSTLRSTARPFPTTGAAAGTPVCAAPGATDQLECYCTTSTCGAGMLDTGAAVAAVARLQAHVHAVPATPVPNEPVTLSAAQSSAANGRSIVSRTWSLAATGGIVGALNVAADGSFASATPSATGAFRVRLTVTDDLGATATSTETITVVAAAPLAPPAAGGDADGGGGGGGAFGLAWLAALLAATLLLSHPSHRRPRDR
jgi:serine protease